MSDEQPEGGPVNHPPHYNKHPSGVECIDIIEHLPFNLGNAVKYVWRAGEKGNEIEDLEKARWYLRRQIEGIGSGELEWGEPPLILETVATVLKVQQVGPLRFMLASIVAAHHLDAKSTLGLPLLEVAEVLLSTWIVQARLSQGARGAT